MRLPWTRIVVACFVSSHTEKPHLPQTARYLSEHENALQIGEDVQIIGGSKHLGRTGTLQSMAKVMATVSLHESGISVKKKKEFLVAVPTELEVAMEDDVAIIEHATAPKQDETMDSLSRKVSIALDNLPSSMSLYDRERKILATRMPNLSLNRTYLAPSTIPGAGHGIFARDNYKEGTILTCFPADALLYGDDDLVWGDHVDQARLSKQEPDGRQLFHYLIELSDEEEEVCLVGVPQWDQDPAYLGHLINDGALHLPQSLADVAQYEKEAHARANVEPDLVLENCHMVMVATRDIVEAEELFFRYGPDYWLTPDEEEEELELEEELEDGYNDEDIDDEDPTEEYCSTMTVKQLKEELKKRGLGVSGKKADLIYRLQLLSEPE